VPVPRHGRAGGSEEQELLQDALLKRAQEAIEAAARIVSTSDVLAHVSEDLRETGMTSRCAWCGRYRIGDRWMVLGQSRLIATSRTTHGICEDCIEVLRAAGLSA
jgi:hypothetical protein